MSGPNDIDITSDLVDGTFDDGAVHVNGAPGTQSVTPPDTVRPEAVRSTPVAAPTDDTKKEPSLRDQLTNAFKGEDGKPSDQENAQSVQAPEVPELKQDANGKYRNPDGTFATAEQIQAFEAAKAAPTGENAVATPDLAAKMTAAEYAQFQALPAELQQYVAATMEAMELKASKYADYDLLEQVIGPRRDAWLQGGNTPATAVQQLLALSDFAGRAPDEFVMWFAQQHNLDLDALLDQAEAAANTVDPVLQGLQSEVQQLKSVVTQFQNGQSTQVHTQRLQTVEQFASEKDGNGNFKRPYFAEVASDIMTLVPAIRQQNPNLSDVDVLSKAYENACWTNPAIRAKMQEETERQRIATAQANALRAKNAGSSIAGGPTGDTATVPNNSSLSLRDELRKNFAAYS